MYSNIINNEFDTIANLIDVSTIDSCYESSSSSDVPGIKDEHDNWSIEGHPDRIVKIGTEEIDMFSVVFDGEVGNGTGKLPSVHATQLVDALKCFANQNRRLFDIRDEIFTTEMYHETNSQKEGLIVRQTGFPSDVNHLIYSGPHIGVANPLFQTPKRVCETHRAYDEIDLLSISAYYIPRSNYSPQLEKHSRYKDLQTSWGTKYSHQYRILMRNMFNLSGERTLISAVVPPGAGHIHAVFGICFKDLSKAIIVSAAMSSIPFDFFIKITGKGSGGNNVVLGFPQIDCSMNSELLVRGLLLNCVTSDYSELWRVLFDPIYTKDSWSKKCPQLNNDKFLTIVPKWSWDTSLRTDYERRQALVEIDVLVSMALGMTLHQLKTIYRLQFPVLQSYEMDTWYDVNGRIVFTTNRSLSNTGLSRSEWERIKDANKGVFSQIVEDDTQPGGPVTRTIEYVAPFDRCDREKDYEIAWEHFSKRFGL